MSESTEPEQAARETKDPYRELFERSADAILIIEGGRFVDCNRATVRMLRYESRDDVLRTHPAELSPPRQPDGRDSREKADAMIARAFEQGSHRFEWDHRRADGEVFPVEVLLTAIRKADRPTLHVVWRDITERRRLESELRQTQKMEAVGQLAGGIAHDFNNLLVSILGNASLLKEIGNPDPSSLARIDEILWAGERAAELVGQLLAFSRKQILKPAILDLNAAVEGLRRLFRRTIGEDVEIEIRTSEDPLPVRADPVQMEQVVMNLVTNARDAMPSGGTITLETASIDLVEGAAPPGVSLTPGPHVLLRVSDTGTGMDEETLRHAFDPFYTTKEPGQGTGLGLSTAYGVVRQSGGDVLVRSAPGLGTRIDVYLPRSEEPLTANAEEAEAPARGGSETILVVEDDDAVASLVSEVLAQAGYDVLRAANGLAAREVFLADADRIGLILTDVVMPEMGGPEFVADLERRGYRPRVLYASGYTSDALQSRGFLEKGVDLICKPYRPRRLLARVREALDRPD